MEKRNEAKLAIDPDPMQEQVNRLDTRRQCLMRNMMDAELRERAYGPPEPKPEGTADWSIGGTSNDRLHRRPADPGSLG